MNEAKNIWEVIPDFASMWKRETNENYVIVIEGLYASIASYVVTRKDKRYIHYVAIIRSLDFKLIPETLQNDTISIVEAKRWSEQWLRHFYRHVQLQKQVECYDSWLKHYQEELTKVQNHINEQKWEEIRQSFRDVLGDKGGEA